MSDAIFAHERRREIARIVESAGRARVADLALRFGVSGVTIRKDLLILERDHQVVRAHGGAFAPSRMGPEAAFDIRELLQSAEKTRIGAAAAGRVADGESVVLDSSTTALYVARSLKRRGPWQALTIVTNGIRIALELAGHPGITVLVPGGRVRWEALSVVGPFGSGVYRRVNISKAFLGAVGFTIESGLSDATEEEAQAKRPMVAAAKEVFALVDHTKCGRLSAATFCRVDKLTGVITDDDAPPWFVEQLRAIGVDVELVPK